MARKTTYEWSIELLEEGDIVDSDFSETINGLPGNMLDLEPNHQVCLVKNIGSETETIVERGWAYIKDGVLPEDFDNGDRVPARFHREIETYKKQKGVY